MEDYFATSLISKAWAAQYGQPVIDLEAGVEPPNKTEMAVAISASPMAALATPLTDVELHDVISEASSCITRLKVNISLDPMNPQSDRISHSLFSMPSLQYLDLGVKYKRYGHEGPAMTDCSNLTQLVGQLPNLKELCLRANHTCRETFCQLNSRGLEVINVEDSSKAFWISECICPSLKRFICNGSFYGNGVRPSLRSQQDIFSRVFNESFPESHGFQGMQVPDSCIIFFLLSRGW